MKLKIDPRYAAKKEGIINLLNNFDRSGEALGNNKRNEIKIFDLEGTSVNVKSFKVPNSLNKIAYKFFRKSKAQRSFEYAHRLIDSNIGTPYPVAYAEQTTGMAFLQSFYISEQLDHDFSFRDLVDNWDLPGWEEALKAFTQFTFRLHENKIEFLDHSPGNTLIKVHNKEYQFYLVDLNRMNFRKLSYEERLKNFSRLTPYKEMVEVMAVEYAKLFGKPEQEVFEKMWFYTTEFQRKFHRKKAIKRKLKFWKR